MTSLKTFSILFTLYFSLVTFGYTQVNAIATYSYEWASLGYKKDYQLIINQQFSKYQNHRVYSEFTTEEGYLVEFSKNYYDWYYDALHKKIIEQRVLKNDTKVIATWGANLTWEITEETKEIAGYKVQKAITQSHDMVGRNNEWDYGDAIAWFTTEIPIGTGPERYYGLPGLIVYLQFTNNPTTYTLKNIQWGGNTTINIPTEGIKVSKEQTLRYFELINPKWLKQQKKLQKSN